LPKFIGGSCSPCHDDTLGYDSSTTKSKANSKFTRQVFQRKSIEGLGLEQDHSMSKYCTASCATCCPLSNKPTKSEVGLQ